MEVSPASTLAILPHKLKQLSFQEPKFISPEQKIYTQTYGKKIYTQKGILKPPSKNFPLFQTVKTVITTEENKANTSKDTQKVDFQEVRPSQVNRYTHNTVIDQSQNESMKTMESQTSESSESGPEIPKFPPSVGNRVYENTVKRNRSGVEFDQPPPVQLKQLNSTTDSTSGTSKTSSSSSNDTLVKNMITLNRSRNYNNLAFEDDIWRGGRRLFDA